MNYEISFKQRSIKDLKAIPADDRRRIVARIEELENGFRGNIKRLTNFSPEYRLRVGDYRVLFEVEGEKIVIYRVKHRKDAYS